MNLRGWIRAADGTPRVEIQSDEADRAAMDLAVHADVDAIHEPVVIVEYQRARPPESVPVPVPPKLATPTIPLKSVIVEGSFPDPGNTKLNTCPNAARPPEIGLGRTVLVGGEANNAGASGASRLAPKASPVIPAVVWKN
jgi:hypothetical protein